MLRNLVGILLAVSMSVALSWSLCIATPPAGVPWPSWYAVFNTLAQALLAVAPGFLVGWYVGRNGLLLGTIVGVLISIASLIVLWLSWGPVPVRAVVLALTFGTLANIITQSVAGAGGQFVRSRHASPN
jgi:hypothetical protein